MLGPQVNPAWATWEATAPTPPNKSMKSKTIASGRWRDVKRVIGQGAQRGRLDSVGGKGCPLRRIQPGVVPLSPADCQRASAKGKGTGVWQMAPFCREASDEKTIFSVGTATLLTSTGARAARIASCA